MEALHAHCAGLDVHKDSVVACVLHTEGRSCIQSFGTSSREILRLGDWLAQQGVRAVAMESTGVFWKPIWNLLEDRFELMLVNPQHVQRVRIARRMSATASGSLSCCSMGCLVPPSCQPAPSGSCVT